MLKQFSPNDETLNIFNNFLLSKYSFMIRPDFLIPKLRIDIEFKYFFKNIDETLFIFWLFYILWGGIVPAVKFSKSNKKNCIMLFKNISIELVVNLLNDFLYNTRIIHSKKKNFKYISDHKFLCQYKKSSDNLFFCQFSSVFKQNNLEHIFYDLGVSGIKLFFKLTLKASPNNNSIKSNVYCDILKMLDIENILKSYMFEESLK